VAYVNVPALDTASFHYVLLVPLGGMNVIIGMICVSVLSKAADGPTEGKLQLLQSLHDLRSTIDRSNFKMQKFHSKVFSLTELMSL